VLLLTALAGCGLFRPREGVSPTPAGGPYAGLADKSVAIVIYAQPATTDEYAGVREEISAFIANQLRQHLPTTRILDPQEVITWQNSTINWFGLSERDIGRHFSVDRVLTVRVLDYSTKRILRYSDLQGRLRAKCLITEIDPPAAATAPDGRPATADTAPAAPAWAGVIDAAWPPSRPLDPTQTNENAVRLRTLEAFAARLVGHFHGDEGGTAGQ
jgi:hypothetical protein